MVVVVVVFVVDPAFLIDFRGSRVVCVEDVRLEVRSTTIVFSFSATPLEWSFERLVCLVVVVGFSCKEAMGFFANEVLDFLAEMLFAVKGFGTFSLAKIFLEVNVDNGFAFEDWKGMMSPRICVCE